MTKYPAIVLMLSLALSVDHSAQGASWIGRKVLPKSDHVMVRVQGRAPQSVVHVQWPAAVKTVDGQWLWIEDEGAVRQPPVAGWIRTEDAVLANEALDYANHQMAVGAPSSGLYWLRGISWENAGEFDLASKDYQEAVRLNSSNSDARLGVARMLAKASKYDEGKFNDADKKCPSSPRLHAHWGTALESAKQPDQASDKYNKSAQLNPNWREPYYHLGQLAASRGDYDGALKQFEEAIRRDASFHAAHRERAKALLATKHDEGSAKLALGWAWTACDLCYFRDAESLAVLASALADLKQWPEALRYQQMAIEYAPVDARERHLRQWNAYVANLPKLADKVASNDAKNRSDDEQDRGIAPADATDAETSRAATTPSIPVPSFVDRSGMRFGN